MKEKFWLTFISLFATFFINAQEVFQYPDSLYKAEKFMDAIIEYERVVLNSTDPKITNEARYRKALAYRDKMDYGKAVDALGQISYFGLVDSLHFKYRYQIAFCNYLNRNFTECESQLIMIENFIKDTLLIEKTYLLRALNYNELLEWDKAQIYAEKYLENTNPIDSTSISDITEKYSKKNLPKLKNKKLAEILKFVPGFGQIYAGAVAEGIFNLSLNIASIYLGVNQVLCGFYVTGYFTASIPVSKFYFGSRKRTDFLIDKKNYERVRAFNDEVKSLLLD